MFYYACRTQIKVAANLSLIIIKYPTINTNEKWKYGFTLSSPLY
jgi:hypothetical protein